jgi:hypothetical protein
MILGVPWMGRHNACPDWEKCTITLHSDHCRHHCLRAGGGRPMTVPCADSNTSDPVDVAEATTENSARLAHNGNEMFAILHIQRYVDPELEQQSALRRAAEELTGEPCPPPLEFSAMSQIAIDKFTDKNRTVTDPLTVLPPQYRESADVFSLSSADQLLSHRTQDHETRLHEGKQPHFFRLRGMPQAELSATKEYTDDLLARRFIRSSSSPAAAPILFVRKTGGRLRFRADHRLIREILDKLTRVKYFSKFDIIAAFNNTRVKQGDKWKTAFNSHSGQYEYLIMPFGLCNAPGTSQSYMKRTLHEHLDILCTGHFDNVTRYWSPARPLGNIVPTSKNSYNVCGTRSCSPTSTRANSKLRPPDM